VKPLLHLLGNATAALHRLGLVSLRVLLPLGLLALAAVVLAFMYLTALNHDRLESEGDVQREQALLASRTQASIEYSLREQHAARVQAEFSTLSSLPEIRVALLADEHGKVLAASRLEWVGKDAGTIGLYVAQDRREGGNTWLTADHDRVLSSYPVALDIKSDKLAPQRTGTLFIAADLSFDLSARNARTDSWMLKTILLSMTIALLSWLALYFAVSRRIAKLLQAVERVGKRRLDVSCGVSGYDEIGRMGVAFDGMMSNLGLSYERVRKLSHVVEQCANSIIITDAQGVIEYVNPYFTHISGFTPEQAVGKRPSILKSGNTASQEYQAMWQAIASGNVWHGELQNRHRGGRLYWDLVTISPLRGEEGEITHFVSVQEDITARKKIEEQLQLFLRVVNHVNEGITITDTDRNIVFINPAFSAITGYSAEEVIGKNPRMLHSGLMDDVFYRDMWRSINETGLWQGEMIDRRKSGESYSEWLSISTIKDEHGAVSHYIALFSDISERKAVEERIAHMAQHDFLTGLPNRMLLQDRLVQAISRSDREQRKVAVMFMDLDRFKVINDTLGHLVGDKLLQEVADRISRVGRSSDTVCRQGGDEFVIMLTDLETVDDVAIVAVKLLESIAGPYLIDGNEIEVTTSIGISVFPEDGREVDALLQHADAAMYHAKENGRNNYQFFTSEMNEHALERMSIERKLRRALERNEFCLHYQPQVDLRSGRIVGAEALIRWNHSLLGMVSPAQFIPIAEENGLIIPIGEWVLREACRQNSEWRKLGLPEIVMAVNLSAVQFRQKDLGAMIVDILRQSGLAPSALELEITESSVMRNSDAAIELLQQLKEMGLKLSMDDFGTGYSSLGYLKRLPIGKLKIDQSFVRDLMTDPDDAVIAQTIITMAHSLKLKVVAEGVETAEQLAFLQQQQCDEMQGYYFSRPLVAEQFASLLASQSDWVGAPL
jgi:diguanylate cyclase (GGDEF)-like protein/PAS domain S-box-containing protein